jgi:hypothetical protein
MHFATSPEVIESRGIVNLMKMGQNYVLTKASGGKSAMSVEA